MYRKIQKLAGRALLIINTTGDKFERCDLAEGTYVPGRYLDVVRFSRGRLSPPFSP